MRTRDAMLMSQRAQGGDSRLEDLSRLQPSTPWVSTRLCPLLRVVLPQERAMRAMVEREFALIALSSTRGQGRTARFAVYL